MSEVNVLDKLTSRRTEVETDHGGFGLGDLIVIVLGIVLLCYTGYRTWHVLSTTVPTDAEVISVLGLWGLDIGAVAWSMVWIFGSTTWLQNVVSISMWVIDLLGMIGTSLVDTLAPVGKLPGNMATIIYYGVVIIIAGNVVVGFIYHMASPNTRRIRRERKLNEELAREREDELFALKQDELRSQNELDKQRVQLEQSERLMGQRQVLIERLKQVAQQKVTLDGIERGLAKVLDDNQHVEDIANQTRRAVQESLGARTSDKKPENLFDRIGSALAPAKNGDENHPN